MTSSRAGRVRPAGTTAAAESLAQRELEVAREIGHAFLTATRPVELYRLALARVTPLVEATFSSVFSRDSDDPSLLKLACAHNWPQASARYLGQLRIRVGRGPTGRAVDEGRAMEVENVFSDPELREWWEPAKELGFTSLIALPLGIDGVVHGALTFYFDGPHQFSDDERRLLALTADQLAAMVEKSRLIEDLRAANEQLRAQNQELTLRVAEAEDARRLKNEFLANISHEFRTPLTSILGYTYLLSHGHEGQLPEGQATAAGKIERSADALLRLVTDLLDLSQLKLGRAECSAAPEDAKVLTERALEIAGPPGEHVALRVELPETALAIETDGDKVVKILENLVSNALKFTVRGHVRMALGRGPGPLPSSVEGVAEETVRPAEAEGEWVEWTVEDTGIGIRPADLEAIFDEFRQVDGSSTRLYGGTGLGLSLSLRLARLLGGDIAVRSEVGVGSSFTLRLPARPRT